MILDSFAFPKVEIESGVGVGSKALNSNLRPVYTSAGDDDDNDNDSDDDDENDDRDDDDDDC